MCFRDRETQQQGRTVQRQRDNICARVAANHPLGWLEEGDWDRCYVFDRDIVCLLSWLPLLPIPLKGIRFEWAYLPIHVYIHTHMHKLFGYYDFTVYNIITQTRSKQCSGGKTQIVHSIISHIRLLFTFHLPSFLRIVIHTILLPQWIRGSAVVVSQCNSCGATACSCCHHCRHRSHIKYGYTSEIIIKKHNSRKCWMEKDKRVSRCENVCAVNLCLGQK